MDANEITEVFIDFERENNMFDIWVEDCQLWIYIRFQVNEVIQQQMGLWKGEIFTNRKEKEKIKKSVIDRFKDVTVHNQFFARQRDVLIVPLSRKVKENGQYKCIHTDLLDRALKRTHYIWDRRNTSDQFLPQNSKNIIYMDERPFLKMKKVKTLQFDQKWFDEKIIQPIEAFFKITLKGEHKRGLFWAAKQILEVRKKWMYYYQYMFKRIKPKAIVVVCYYYWDIIALCETAKEMGIPLIELQHGIIGREHIAYNFPDAIRTKGIPDYLFVFGKYDKSAIRFPIPKKNILPVGFPELEKKSISEKHTKKSNKKNILFISSMMPEIFNYANSIAESLDSEKYNVILKLHPAECGGWKKVLGKYITSKKVEIIDTVSANVYSYLQDADWVIGTMSTVLLEATLFDVKIAIIQTNNSTAAKILYESDNAILVSSEAELVSALNTDQFVPKGELSIFEKDSLVKMVKGIEYVIKTFHTKN